MNMLHHISLPVSNLNRSKQFYDTSLKELGYRCVFSSSDFAGYGKDANKDKFGIKQVKNVVPAGPGFHLAFSAPSRLPVDRFYEAALDLGAKGHGVPGLREKYGPYYYTAFIIDLDGHIIEAVINSPETI